MIRSPEYQSSTLIKPYCNSWCFIVSRNPNFASEAATPIETNQPAFSKAPGFRGGFAFVRFGACGRPETEQQRPLAVVLFLQLTFIMFITPITSSLSPSPLSSSYGTWRHPCLLRRLGQVSPSRWGCKQLRQLLLSLVGWSLLPSALNGISLAYVHQQPCPQNRTKLQHVLLETVTL